MDAHAFEADAARTACRTAALASYFESNVATAGAFICPSAVPCKCSHDGDFYPAQLHHVGKHYDLVRGGKALRIVVVGQEYGHAPAFVSLTARSEMVVGNSGDRCRFKADGRLPARNPHMRGCTSLLRLIFGVGLGADREGEFLSIDGEPVHIFECFALVNFLLCSAVPTPAVAVVAKRLAGKPGRSTRIMQTNCATHFRAALEILEPTLVIAQGYGVREWMARAYGLPARRPHDGVEQVQIGGAVTTLLSFSHPSAHGALNWGVNERTSYLLNTVAPRIERAVAG